jgi:hypothetical protein
MAVSCVRWARLLVLLPICATILLSADPVLGTWKLNVRRSTFRPGPGFQNETRTYEEQKDGVKVTIRTVDARGRLVESVYLTTPDGEQHPVSGSGGPADSVGLKRVDEFTAESTLLHAGKEIAKTTRVVSADGKTMTITYKGLDPRGDDVHYTLVFDRLN